MESELVKKSYSIFNYAIKLKERLDAGEALDIEREQGTLTGMLNGVEPYGVSDQGGGGVFLGARYALACWLDEYFIVYTSWADAWNGRKLEVKFYGGTSQRFAKFWEQAELAQKRHGKDVLEVYFLCVVLGFRGKMINDPGALQVWVENTRRQVIRAGEWPSPRDRGVTTNVEPLTGRQLFRRRLVVQGALTLIVVLVNLLLLRFASTS